MSELIEVLQAKFGQERVAIIYPVKDDEIELLEIKLNLRTPVTLIMTHGLSNYNMPVPEKLADRAHNEIYFCLPSYWEYPSKEPQFQWPFEWIQKLAKHVVEKDTWYAHAHTFSNGNPSKPLSSTMKQEYLLLSDPVLLEDSLQPVKLKSGITVNFLAVIPIYDNELSYKNAKGMFKFMKKFRGKNGDEKLDDFRESCLKSRFRLF